MAMSCLASVGLPDAVVGIGRRSHLTNPQRIEGLQLLSLRMGSLEEVYRKPSDAGSESMGLLL